MTQRRRQLLFRPAFTTIELLIAMGIVVLLAGLVFVGFKAIGGGGKTRATRNTLETAKSLLNEVQIAKGLPYVKAVYSSPPNGTKYLYPFPPLPAGQSPTPLPAPVDGSNNGDMSEEGYTATHNIRYKSDAVLRTQMVMARCQTVAANRSTLSLLPAGSFLRWGQPATPPLTNTIGVDLQIATVSAGSGTRYTVNPQVLVDSWNNPIIYVPPAGLRGVYLSDETNKYANRTAATERVVTSVRVRRPYNPGSTTNSRAEDYYNFDPGATGFWASAGADGDFTKGDDNIYSFEGF